MGSRQAFDWENEPSSAFFSPIPEDAIVVANAY